MLEVLLSLSIFSVALVGIIEAVTIQVRAEKQAEDATRATILAQNIFEEIRYSEDFDEESETGEFEDADAGFEWGYTMVETETQDLYRVTVVISWSDGLARKDYTLESYLAKRTLSEDSVLEIENVNLGTDNAQR